MDGQEERVTGVPPSFRALRVYLPVRVEQTRDVMVGWLLIGVMTVVPIHDHFQDVDPVRTVVG